MSLRPGHCCTIKNSIERCDPTLRVFSYVYEFCRLRTSFQENTRQSRDNDVERHKMDRRVFGGDETAAVRGLVNRSAGDATGLCISTRTSNRGACGEASNEIFSRMPYPIRAKASHLISGELSTVSLSEGDSTVDSSINFSLLQRHLFTPIPTTTPVTHASASKMITLILNYIRRRMFFSQEQAEFGSM